MVGNSELKRRFLSQSGKFNKSWKEIKIVKCAQWHVHYPSMSRNKSSLSDDLFEIKQGNAEYD